MVAPLITERRPPIPIPPHKKPEAGVPYQVKDGDDWQSVARIAGLESWPWDLIYFNFKTFNPDVVNWYLREYVGCVRATPDGKNWKFSSGLTGGRGVWKGGTVWLPSIKIDFEGDVLLGMSDELLGSRLPTAADRREGKRFLKDFETAAKRRANIYGKFDHSTVAAWLKAAELAAKGSAAAEAFELVEALELAGFSEPIVIAGVATPIALEVAGLALVLYEIGEANEWKDIAARRREYYGALADGMAAGFDPNFVPGVPKNALRKAIYEQGRRAVEKLSVRQKRQLALEAILTHYFKTAIPGERRPSTLEGYRNLLTGKKFREALMNDFESNILE